MAAMIASTEREELRLWNLDVRDRNSERIATADFPPGNDSAVHLAHRSPDEVHAAMRLFFRQCNIYSVPHLERSELLAGLEPFSPEPVGDYKVFRESLSKQLPKGRLLPTSLS